MERAKRANCLFIPSKVNGASEASKFPFFPSKLNGASEASKLLFSSSNLNGASEASNFPTWIKVDRAKRDPGV